MKKTLALFSSLALALSVFATSVLPATAADFTLAPFVFDPGSACDAVAEFRAGEGLPDADGVNNFAVYLQKNCATATFAAVGVDIISPLEGGSITALQELNFDVRDDGHCGAGAPRFNVQVDGNTYFLGCTQGTHTQASGPGWTHVAFGPADFALAGIPTSGTLEDVYIIFDEGTDTPLGGSIVAAGHVFIDNISVNNTSVGAPAVNPGTVLQLNCLFRSPFSKQIILQNITCKFGFFATYQPLPVFCKLANRTLTFELNIPGVPKNQLDFKKLCKK